MLAILACLFGNAASRVCVFDVGGTLQHMWADHDNCTSTGPRNAIASCLFRNYTVAINTFELAKDAEYNKQKLESGVGLPAAVANDPSLWKTQADPNQTRSKVLNMDAISQYTGVPKQCIILFDDELINIQAVAAAGYLTQKAWTAANATECHILSEEEVPRTRHTLNTL